MSNDIAVTQLVESVKSFFPKGQLQMMVDAIYDTEDEDWQANRDYYIGILQRFQKTFEQMPKTYDTEPQVPEGLTDEEASDYIRAQAGEAMVYLHYFAGGCDWWITEKDRCPEQFQAFGVASLNGWQPEFGYISLEELADIMVVNLDFDWQPTKLKDISELKRMFSKEDSE